MSGKSSIHRVWQAGTFTLLLVMSVQLTLSSFFKSPLQVTEHSPLLPEHAAPGRKVIYVLFDALREDFVEWPADE